MVTATASIMPMAVQNPSSRSSSGMVWKFMPKMPLIRVAGMKMMVITVSRRTSTLRRLLTLDRYTSSISPIRSRSASSDSMTCTV